MRAPVVSNDLGTFRAPLSGNVHAMFIKQNETPIPMGSAISKDKAACICRVLIYYQVPPVMVLFTLRPP